MLLPNRRDGDGNESRNNSTPSGANLSNATENAKNADGNFAFRAVVYARLFHLKYIIERVKRQRYQVKSETFGCK